MFAKPQQSKINDWILCKLALRTCVQLMLKKNFKYVKTNGGVIHAIMGEKPPPPVADINTKIPHKLLTHSPLIRNRKNFNFILRTITQTKCKHCTSHKARKRDIQKSLLMVPWHVAQAVRTHCCICITTRSCRNVNNHAPKRKTKIHKRDKWTLILV